ncbi:hypothetical protein M440DRAFT_1133178 [Trichoderma longibrachiatum ATCC 18648]|uniref:Uncharacterized protein n=1 Tax=Trichoderma longibrachiatum ATCC 18648 TaxID=983965 RepID=A0A2T4CGI6_TRILO|nr:hypothetical protein M440DRAFT_1133178 [Trichoderma longibrachiatum ATCC 18648]
MLVPGLLLPGWRDGAGWFDRASKLPRIWMTERLAEVGSELCRLGEKCVCVCVCVCGCVDERERREGTRRKKKRKRICCGQWVYKLVGALICRALLSSLLLS